MGYNHTVAGVISRHADYPEETYGGIYGTPKLNVRAFQLIRRIAEAGKVRLP